MKNKRNRLPTGTLTKRGSTWWIRWFSHGVAHAQSLHTPDIQEASRIFGETMSLIRADIIRGMKSPQPNPAGNGHNDYGNHGPSRGEALAPLAKDYLADLKACGRDEMYVYVTGRHLDRLFRECGWTRLCDIDAAGFIKWRSAQAGMAPKTLNEYQGAVSAFLSWLMKCGRASGNPLSVVTKVQTRGREVRVRRAFSDDELAGLLEVASPCRRAVYVVAVCTGLRRAELAALTWGDVMIDGEAHHIIARASTTKNHNESVIALHPDAVTSLLEVRPEVAGAGTAVFPVMPTSEEFKADLKKAGIPVLDPQGRRVDFHSLRHTLATRLAVAGIQPRVAMEVMRHSDMRLTQKVYTDASLLPTLAAVRTLPSLFPPRR